MIYMVLVTIMTFNFAFLKREKLNKKYLSLDYYWFLFFVFVLILFYGLRWNVGIDYMSYYNMAANKTWMLVRQGGGTLELGFQFLYYFEDFFNLPIFSYVILGGTIIFIFLFNAIYDNSDNYALSLFIFFSSGLLFFAFNEFRQFIAVAIIFYGYKFCHKKNFLSWCFICILAFFFHKSSILYLPIYFLWHKKFSRFFINICILCAIVIKQFDILFILKFIIGFFPGHYHGYVEVLELIKTKASGITGYVYIFISFLLNNSKKRKYIYVGRNAAYINFFIVATLVSNIFAEYYMVTRIVEYLLICIVIVYPIFYKDSKQSMFKYILFCAITAFFLVNLIKYAFFSPKASLLTYQTVFSR